jgi:hypothetical protein
MSYKYRIQELMQALPHTEYKKAWLELPTLCGVTKPTFKKWYYRKTHDGMDVPAIAFLRIAIYLKVDPVDLVANKDEVFFIDLKLNSHAEN